MSITIRPGNPQYVVDKLWGHEEIYVNDRDSNYCLKRLVLNKGPWRCSKHKHDKKTETFHVIEGVLHLWTEVDGFSTFSSHHAGSSVTITPGTLHSFWSHLPTSFYEVSTHDTPEDSIRADGSCEIDRKYMAAWNAWPGNYGFLVVGDVMLDEYVTCAAGKMSAEAPMLVMKQEGHVVRLPGGAANLAAEIMRLGGNVGLVGVTGDDPQASTLGHVMGQYIGETWSSTMLAFDEEDKSRITTVKRRYVVDGRQVFRCDQEMDHPINEKLQSRIIEIIDEQLEEYEYGVVLVSDYGKGVVSSKLMKFIEMRCEQAGIPYMVDPSVKNYGPGFYGRPHVMKPNASEAMAMSGTRSPEEAVMALQDSLKTDVVVTAGEEGVFVATGGSEKPAHVRAHRDYRTEVAVDVCGAGDTFFASLAAGYVTNLSLIDATKMAHESASRKVQALRFRA